MSSFLEITDVNLGIPELLRGKIKTIGMIYNEFIKCGDVNLIKQGDLYYLNSAKQVLRFFGTNIVEDTKYYIFDTITPCGLSLDDYSVTIPEEQLGTSHRVGYLFNDIIYGGDINLVPNGELYYNLNFPFISIISSDETYITVNTKIPQMLEDTYTITNLQSQYDPTTGVMDSYEGGELEISWIEDTKEYSYPEIIHCEFELLNIGEKPIHNIIIANKTSVLTPTEPIIRYDTKLTVPLLTKKDGKIIAGFDIPTTPGVPGSVGFLTFDLWYKSDEYPTWASIGSISYKEIIPDVGPINI